MESLDKCCVDKLIFMARKMKDRSLDILISIQNWLVVSSVAQLYAKILPFFISCLEVIKK